MATCATISSALEPAALGRRVSLSLTDILLGVMLVWAMIPETLVGDIYFLDVPMRFLLFYCATASCMISTLFFGLSTVTPYLKVALIAMLLMAGMGIFWGNDLKFWVVDVSNYTGLVLGLYWARRNSLQSTVNTLYWWSVAIGTVLLLNIVGLLLGIIPQANEGERLYSYSLFTSTAFVTCLFPFWFTASSTKKGVTIPPRARKMAVTCIGCVVLASVLSATRSMFLTGAVAVTIVVWLRLHGKNAAFWMFTTLASCLIFMLTVFNSESWLSSRFADRLASTELVEEYRYIELQMMFEQLEGSFLTGKGFGSRFESCIGRNSEFRAYAPHVAIFTTLFKGGVATFALIIVVPVVMAVFNLVRLNRNTMCLSFSAAVILYCTQGAMSGGWNYIALFLYGTMHSLATRCAATKNRYY